MSEKQSPHYNHTYMMYLCINYMFVFFYCLVLLCLLLVYLMFLNLFVALSLLIVLYQKIHL